MPSLLALSLLVTSELSLPTGKAEYKRAPTAIEE
jgi:hypothetical protein